MRKIFFKILLVTDIFAFLSLIVLSQFLIRYDTVSGITTDGFGRVLREAPIFFKSSGLMNEWAGIGWFLFDTFCSFILMAIAYLIFNSITDRRR